MLAAKVREAMLNEALQKVATALDGLEIPYALIGGLAVAARGAIRATQDVDLIVEEGYRLSRG